uniref:Uncharacterized protein n=1 Tax=Aegilops tauschii subsp. strangulata TaxID=200361 RepID=A0A453A545_AEGTS
MEHLLQQFEAMSGHVKEAVSMGARAEKTSSENAEKIIQLLTEISVTLREVPPSSTGSFADRFMRMSKYPFEAGQVYEQFRQYLEFLGGFLLLLGKLYCSRKAKVKSVRCYCLYFLLKLRFIFSTCT